MSLSVGDKVELKTFNGSKTAPLECIPEENHWSLVSEVGQVIQDPIQKDLFANFSSAKSVCIVFDKNLTELTLDT